MTIYNNNKLHFVSYNIYTLKYKHPYDKCLQNNDIRYFDAIFWDKFINNKNIELEYLHEIFTQSHKNFNINNNYVLAFKNNQLVGILVYSLLPCNIYKIMLVAKKHDCFITKIGKSFFEYLEHQLESGTFILIDDSKIPHYYENMGFIKSNGYINYIFGDHESPSYYKTFGEENTVLCCCGL